MRLGVGQRVLGAHPVAQRAGERVDALLESLRRDLLAGAVGLHPLGQRPASAQRRVDLAVRVAVPVDVALGDVDVEVLADLLDEADVLARELAARARQRLQVGGEVVGALGVETVGVRHGGQQTLGGRWRGRPGRGRARTPRPCATRDRR